MSSEVSPLVNAKEDTIDNSHHQLIVVLDSFNNVLVVLLCVPPLLSICLIKALQTADNAILFATMLCGLLGGVWHMPMTIIANLRNTNDLILAKKLPCMLLHASRISSENFYFTLILLMSIHNGIVIFNFLWYEQNFTNRVVAYIVTVLVILHLIHIGWLYSTMKFDPTVENLVYRCKHTHNFSRESRYYHTILGVVQLVFVFILNFVIFCITYIRNRAVRRNSEHIATAFILRYDLIRDTSVTHMFFCFLWGPTIAVMFYEDVLEEDVSYIVADISRVLRHTSLVYYPLAYCLRRELLNRSFALIVTTPCWRWHRDLRNLSNVTMQENMEFLLRRKGIRVSLLSQMGPKSSVAKSSVAPTESSAAYSDKTDATGYFRKYIFNQIFEDDDDCDKFSGFLLPTAKLKKKASINKEFQRKHTPPKRTMSGVSESVLFNPERIVRNYNPSAKNSHLNYGY